MAPVTEATAADSHALTRTLTLDAPGTPPPAAPDPAPAIEVQGTYRYRLGALLGAGSGGWVYRAERVDTGQTVAIKLMREDSVRSAAERERARARFARETRLCESLHDPHIVALLDKGALPDGQLFAVFEFVAGKTLRDVLAAEGALSAVTTGNLMTQVLEGLAVAHRQRVVHRDLKPQNVMITTVDGALCAKILDFGIGALLPDAAQPDLRTLTQSGDVLGSPQYCAPEQLRNEAPTIRTDLYAWGLLVIECLTGQAVMQGASIAEILYQQLSPVDVALPPAIAAHPLGTVLRLALNKDPRQRAASAQALAVPFRALHFEALVGEFNYRRGSTARLKASGAAASGAYRQVTALCCHVGFADDAAYEAQAADPALLDALEAREQQWRTRCADIAVGYGGEVCGKLGDTLLFYFGTQDGIDRPARRAARAALDMMRQAGRARRDEGTPAVQAPVEVAIALHVGPVVAQEPLTGGGATAAAAAKLLRLAAPGSILLSESARQSLERHVHYRGTSLRFVRAGHPPQPVFALLGERHEHVPFDALDQRDIPPLVGRERERETLLRAWRAVVAASDAPGTNTAPDAPGAQMPPRPSRLVVGEPGIGKSRLVYDLCETVRRAGHAFAWCACLPEHINQALFPVLRFVAAHGQIDVDGDVAEALAALDRMIAPLPCNHAAARATLAAWFGLASEPGRLPWSSARQQEALFDVLRAIVASLGDGGPVMFVVEDVQWIDQASANFLESLRRAPSCRSVFIVMTSRPESLERWRASTERTTLRRLSHTDTRALIAKLLDRPGLDTGALEALTKRTAGIPLFVEEIVRELVVSGAPLDAHPPGDESGTPEQQPLPGTLRDMLELAFDRIDGARDIAQLAATIGLEVDAQLLAEVACCEPDVLEDHLKRLLEARVLYAQHRLGGLSYAFRHALIRDAAYESMPPAILHRNHARVARALGIRPERGSGMRTFSIAQHFVRAQAFEEAVPHGIRAAQRALERALHEDAIRYAQTVREWLAHCHYAGQARDAARADLTLVHAMMARFGWADPQVSAHAERLHASVRSLDDPQLIASVLWTVATRHHVASDREAVQRIVVQLLGLAANSKDPGIRVAAHAMQGMSLWIDGHYAAARTALEAALAAHDIARDADHRRVFGLDTRAWSMSALASVMWNMQDDPEPALAMARDAVYSATCAEHLPTLGVTLMYFARMQQCAGERDGARATAEIILRLSRIYGLHAVERYAAVVHAWADGDRDAAVAHIDALRRSGCVLGLTYYASLVAEIDAARGDSRAALREIDACLALCDEIGERYYEAELLLKKAQYLIDTPLRASYGAASEACHKALALAGAAGMSRTATKARELLARLRQPGSTDVSSTHMIPTNGECDE
jgi:TOMM system kinase/cyclase fusion protein